MHSRLPLTAFVVALGCGGHAVPPDASAVDCSGPDAHVFGSHCSRYVGPGVIFPSNHPRAELDAQTTAFYDAWKALYVVAGCAPGQYRIKTAPATTAYTVSEGHGYGMLLAVIFAGHDPDAKTIFDGMYAYYVAHPSRYNAGDMAWAQDETCANVGGPDSATDGDLDIAYALLLADRQWGSSGGINYASAAQQIITSILASDVHPNDSILVGDWVLATDSHYTGTRTSDFATSHFRTFAGIAARANDVVDHTYAVIDYLQVNSAPTTGLLPDFAINAADTPPAPTPAPANWLEGTNDGNYSYNACRVPWRVATDYLVSGEPRAQTAVRRIEAWFRATTGDHPTAIRDGYALDGTVLGSSPELSFIAPLSVGAMIEPASGTSNQAWLDALWDEMVARATGDYYGDTLKLLAMVVVSGNWWLP